MAASDSQPGDAGCFQDIFLNTNWDDLLGPVHGNTGDGNIQVSDFISWDIIGNNERELSPLTSLLSGGGDVSMNVNEQQQENAFLEDIQSALFDAQSEPRAKDLNTGDFGQIISDTACTTEAGCLAGAPVSFDNFDLNINSFSAEGDFDLSEFLEPTRLSPRWRLKPCPDGY